MRIARTIAAIGVCRALRQCNCSSKPWIRNTFHSRFPLTALVAAWWHLPCLWSRRRSAQALGSGCARGYRVLRDARGLCRSGRARTCTGRGDCHSESAPGSPGPFQRATGRFPGKQVFGPPSVPTDEEALRRTQKAQAVDRLRDGIAHDLNNRLMVISANIDAAARQMKDQPILQRKLLSALVASDQAAKLIARRRPSPGSTVRMCNMSSSESGSSPSPPDEPLASARYGRTARVRRRRPLARRGRSRRSRDGHRHLERPCARCSGSGRHDPHRGQQRRRSSAARSADPPREGDFVQLVIHSTDAEEAGGPFGRSGAERLHAA